MPYALKKWDDKMDKPAGLLGNRQFKVEATQIAKSLHQLSLAKLQRLGIAILGEMFVYSLKSYALSIFVTVSISISSCTLISVPNKICTAFPTVAETDSHTGRYKPPGVKSGSY